MLFDPPLVPAKLLRRYKRFLADAELGAEPEPVVAHCGNPGSMMGLAEPGSTIWLSPNRNPKAKLDWRWELVDTGTSLVTVNTGRANTVVAEALDTNRIPELGDYRSVRAEVRYGTNSRIDFLLEDEEKPPVYVEVKSVTLRRPDGSDPDAAAFPDAVTKRGTKHLQELQAVLTTGARAVMLFLVQREDCRYFKPAGDIDPVYANELVAAKDAGVELLCYVCRITPQSIVLDKSLPIQL